MAAACWRAEWSRKLGLKQVSNWRERLANGTLGRMSLLWKAIEALAQPDGPEWSGWVSLATTTEGVRVLRVCGRAEVQETWQVPTLFIDAMLDLELLRQYPEWVWIVSKGAFKVDAPHQKIRQAAERSYSMDYLAPSKPDGLGKIDEDAVKGAGKARLRVKADFLLRERKVGGKAGFISNKSIIDAMDRRRRQARRVAPPARKRKRILFL